MKTKLMALVILAVMLFLGSGRDTSERERMAEPLKYGILIPDSASMARAWEFPQDPRADTAGVDASVLRGFMLFTNTPRFARRFTGGTMTCNNCHPNGGQREKAMPLVGLGRVFPEYNKRAGRVFTLEERIIGCFLRSVNATGVEEKRVVLHHENDLNGATLSPQAEEVQDLAAFIRWLKPGHSADTTLPWRGHNQLPAKSLLPIGQLDPTRGHALFLERCANCHGEDGQGVDIGDKRPGPLWGPNSWNDGAGAARVYTLAGMIRSWMPYMNPGSLTDEEAQHIAAYITSQPRPGFPYKKLDYLKEPLPKDAVYYTQLYPRNPLTAH